MQITLKPTTKLVQLNGVPARVWEGKTDSGIQCHVFVTRVAVRDDEDVTQFETELDEKEPPSEEVQAYPARMVL